MSILVWLWLLPALSIATDEEAEIRYLHVVSDIRFRFAKTRITSRIANPSAEEATVTFNVTLPNTAFITDFRFFSDHYDRYYYGKIKERESAQRRYKVAVEKGEPAGIINKSLKETNLFQVEINIRRGDKITATLTYEEVLQRQKGQYKHDLYILPGQPVANLTIDVAIQESRSLTMVKSPLSVGNALTDWDLSGDTDMLTVQRPNPKSAFIRFHPTLDQQLARWDEGLSGRFSVVYDVERGFDAGDILVSNGYFIHFFAPAVPNPVPKDVLFILDTSTSMFINKLDQVKAAMKGILNDLNPEDRFNIISFGSRVDFWRKDMAEAKQSANIQQALDHLDSLEALGWTNVMRSIQKGFQYLNDNARATVGAHIVFLTDGRATAGETNPEAILKTVKSANIRGIPLYTLAFGIDADWNLVKKLAIQNSGIGKRIYEDGNAAKQIENFYSVIGNTLLNGIQIKYNTDLVRSTTLTFPAYAEGSELVVTGELNIEEELDPMETNIIADSSKGSINLQQFNIVDLEEEFHNMTSLYSELDLERMVRRMHAYVLVKDVLKEMVGETDKREKEKLKQRALTLSLKYNFVTSVTSMVVDTSNEDSRAEYLEDDDLYSPSDPVLTTPAPYYTRPPRYYSGGGGGGSSRGGGGGDPHFIVYMEGLNYPICFDVDGEDKTIYQFVRDPQTDLTVNMRIEKGKKHRQDGGYRKYMTELAILSHELRIRVTRDNINVLGQNYTWKKDYNGTVPGGRIYILYNNSHLSSFSLVLDSTVQIDVTNHVHKDSDSLGGDYLNIELGNSELLSDDTDGIFGQFIHKKIRLQTITYKNDHLIGHLRSRTGLEVKHGRARIVERKDPVWRTSVSCWMLRKMGEGLFDAPIGFYSVSDMFQKTTS